MGALWAILGLISISQSLKKQAKTAVAMAGSIAVLAITLTMQIIDLIAYFKYVRTEDAKSSSFSHTVNFAVFNFFFGVSMIGVLLKGNKK